MRVPQTKASKGSQKWIQLLVNERRDIFAAELAAHLPRGLAENIEWLSPLKNDDYAEYRDVSFLNRLGIRNPKVALRNFWPNRGPQWDALGKAGDDGPYFLVEAKANIPEIVSCCEAKSERSRKLIRSSLQRTPECLGCKPLLDWMTGFYQYANRLAHLYYLRALNKLDARLVFVYFVNDDTHMATSLDQWEAALTLQKKLMGIGKRGLKDSILELFVDTRKL